MTKGLLRIESVFNCGIELISTARFEIEYIWVRFEMKFPMKFIVVSLKMGCSGVCLYMEYIAF